MRPKKQLNIKYSVTEVVLFECELRLKKELSMEHIIRHGSSKWQ
jgi:hypothetical protein